MVTMMLAVRLLLVISALFACAAASGSSPPGFAASQLRPGTSLDFDQVLHGLYTPSRADATSHDAAPASFVDEYFMSGAPIFAFSHRGSRIAKSSLDEALSTFGRFHIYSPATRQGTSIKPDPSNEGLALRTDEFGDVGEYMQRVDATRARFGPHATMLAHGAPTSEITKKYPWSRAGNKTPGWKEVWKAEAVPHEARLSKPEVFRAYLRATLETNRHVRFETKRGSMGLRTLPSGQIEKAFRDLAGETTCFHP